MSAPPPTGPLAAPGPPSTAPPPDPFAAWAGRIRGGDAAAFEALFRATYDGLVRFAAQLADDEAARDLVHDAFARLWERRAELDPARSVRALLYRAVRNRALNGLRDRAARAEKHALLDPDPPPAPDDETDARLLAARLHACVARLPERQREAILLTRVEGLSHDEAADAMAISPRTLNNHLVRALHALRAEARAFDRSF